MEGIIERSIQLCREYLQYFIYPNAKDDNFTGFKLLSEINKSKKNK